MQVVSCIFSIDYIGSWFTTPANNGAQIVADAKAQQVFLNCIHYLTTHGIDALCESIEECVSAAMEDHTLTSVYDAAAIRAIFEELQQKIEQNVGGNGDFAKFVVPTADVRFLSLLRIIRLQFSDIF